MERERERYIEKNEIKTKPKLSPDQDQDHHKTRRKPRPHKRRRGAAEVAKLPVRGRPQGAKASKIAGSTSTETLHTLYCPSKARCWTTLGPGFRRAVRRVERFRRGKPSDFRCFRTILSPSGRPRMANFATSAAPRLLLCGLCFSLCISLSLFCLLLSLREGGCQRRME